jgi:hypothetical protein
MDNNKRSEQFRFHDVFSKEEDCNRTDSMYQYFDGFLSQNEQEQFRKHLQDCDKCSGLLVELQEAESAGLNTVLDATKADKIFSENRTKIQNWLNEKYHVAKLPQPIWNFRIPSYANAMLIVLIAILAFPAYQSFVLKQQVTQLTEVLDREKSIRPHQQKPPDRTQPSVTEPEVSPSLLYPARIERDTATKAISVSFEKNQTFTLLFSLPPEDLQNYSVEIQKQDQTIWQNQMAASGDESSRLISVQLHKEFFQEGKYELKIYGNNGETKTLLSQFKLTISK